MQQKIDFVYVVVGCRNLCAVCHQTFNQLVGSSSLPRPTNFQAPVEPSNAQDPVFHMSNNLYYFDTLCEPVDAVDRSGKHVE